jgi:D-alanine-D-alanine ligase
VVPIYISRNGKWLTGQPLADIKTFKTANLEELMGVRETALPPTTEYPGLVTPPVAGYLAKNSFRRLDVVFPTIHGTHGEDGTLQGLFELANLPYVGCGVLASAVANDKIIAKAVLKTHNIPVLDGFAFSRADWRTDRNTILEKLDEVGYPLFVKPATLGSSIGISRPADKAAAIAAIEMALGFDRRVLAEKALEGALEINCAVLGNDNPRASLLEQPISFQDFFTFEEKYLSGKKGKGMAGAERKIPAPISAALTEKVRAIAVCAFKAIDGRGTARLDFLIRGNEVYLNEINTLPGSLAFYLWQAEGMSPSSLVDELIRLAVEAHQEKRRTIYDYRSELVNQASSRGLKGGKGMKGFKGMKGTR